MIRAKSRLWLNTPKQGTKSLTKTPSRSHDADISILNDFETAIKNLEEHNLTTDFLAFNQTVKENVFFFVSWKKSDLCLRE